MITYGSSGYIIQSIGLMAKQDLRAVSAVRQIFPPDTGWLAYLLGAFRPVLEGDQAQQKTNLAHAWVDKHISLVRNCARSILTRWLSD